MIRCVWIIRYPAELAGTGDVVWHRAISAAAGAALRQRVGSIPTPVRMLKFNYDAISVPPPALLSLADRSRDRGGMRVVQRLWR